MPGATGIHERQNRGCVRLVWIKVLEMIRPDTPKELIERWRIQRAMRKDTDYDFGSGSLSPEPNGCLRKWVGLQSDRDWYRLEAYMIRMGWSVLSHRLELRGGGHGLEILDCNEDFQTMPQVPGV